MEIPIDKLTSFLQKASLATYAGDGPEIRPEREGFKELEYKENYWSYRDSYTGYFRSFGHEIVRYAGKPVWNQLYGGGMIEEFLNDHNLAKKTFSFLKKALSQKQNPFQPRGPDLLEDGDWRYANTLQGGIGLFSGHEEIFFQGRKVFFHNYFGGLIQNK